MKADNFKTKLKEIKSFLIGKEIILCHISKSGTTKTSYRTLRDFGIRILELESEGAGFSFSTVANRYVERRIISESELSEYSTRGKWSTLNITASTL